MSEDLKNETDIELSGQNNQNLVGGNKKIPYPKSVFLILSNEICERFSYVGMRTILSLYLHDILMYSENDSTIIYHVFNMLAFFFPIIGAIISDSWLGRYKTILYVSIIYAAGNLLLALASASPIGLPQAPFSLLGLFLIALGTGGIKPCGSSFGGDQFILPQQEMELASFFSVFYFSINAGSLVSTFLTPVIRKQVQCFGEETCFPLAFAIPGILMIISIVIFALGSRMYIMKKPEGNLFAQVVKCIIHAIRNKSNKEPVDHWLDRSVPRFGQTLVDDIKIALKVLLIFVPLPIFWSLYDQQGSRWTFQAARMDGVIGSYTVLPDQMQVLNPLLILAFIPMFTYGVYPLCAKFNFLTKPLERMIYGGFLGAAAFAISAGVSFALESTDPILPSEGHFQLRLYNPLNCDITALNINGANYSTKIPSRGYEFQEINTLNADRKLKFTFDATCVTEKTGEIDFSKSPGLFYYFTTEGLVGYEDNIDKPEDGLPNVRTLIGNGRSDLNLTYLDGSGNTYLDYPSTNYTLNSFKPGTYSLKGLDKTFKFRLGGVYTILVTLEGDSPKSVKMLETTAANSVHMMWLLPQDFVITLAEILISITGLEFSYSQAPLSMKSVMSGCFLLTIAFGNLLIVIIESVKIFDKQSYDFLLYTGLMIVDMIGFAFLARGYKYNVNSGDKKEDDDEEKKE